MKQQRSRDNVFLNEQEDNLKVREIGQLRRVKMHASCLMEDRGNKCALNSAQRELLEAVFTLQTISILILASYLKRSPASMRNDFRRILAILKAHGRNSVSHQQKEDFHVDGSLAARIRHCHRFKSSSFFTQK